jgi:transposase
MRPELCSSGGSRSPAPSIADNCGSRADESGYGLLRASFRPERRIAALCDYHRRRERLLDLQPRTFSTCRRPDADEPAVASRRVRHYSATGMRIIRAIVAGERNPVTLAALRDQRCKEPAETIRKALVGIDREEHVFTLAQAVQLYGTHMAKLTTATSGLRLSWKKLKATSPTHRRLFLPPGIEHSSPIP